MYYYKKIDLNYGDYMTIKLERTSYTYDDDCSRKRSELIQKRLENENKSLDEKVSEIFQKIGIDENEIYE